MLKINTDKYFQKLKFFISDLSIILKFKGHPSNDASWNFDKVSQHFSRKNTTKPRFISLSLVRRSFWFLPRLNIREGSCNLPQSVDKGALIGALSRNRRGKLAERETRRKKNSKHGSEPRRDFYCDIYI